MAGIFERCWGQLKDAARVLRRQPALTATAVVSLALGIGVNTAVFGVVHAVLLAPLPYSQSERLLAIGRASVGADPGGAAPGEVTLREYELVRARSRALSPVAGFQGIGERRLTWNGEQDWRPTLAVTQDFLRVLQVDVAYGRGFSALELAPGGPPALLVSHALWRTQFAADPRAIGAQVALDEEPYILIGVLPEDFWFAQPADILVPLRHTGSHSETGVNTSLVARLREGHTIAQAQAELLAVSDAFRREAGSDATPHDYSLSAVSYHELLAAPVRPNLLLQFGATTLLLLLTCTNLFTLLLTRFAARERELAVRVALGSSRSRLVTGFLIEHLLIASLGGVAGLLAGYTLLRLLTAWMPWTLPIAGPLQVGVPTFAFVFATAVVMALVFTLVPVLGLRRLNLAASLQTVGCSGAAGRVSAGTRHVLVVLEVAVSTTLLIGAGLVIQSLYRLQQEQLGFAPAGLVTFDTPITPDRRELPHRVTFARAMIDALRGIPGVRGVAAINVLPLSGRSNMPAQREGYPDESIGGMEIRAVTPDYFQLMGIPIREGRAFRETDDERAAPVIVVNGTVARQWFADGGAIGGRILLGRFKDQQFLDDPPREVVGVAADTKTVTLQQAPRPTVFIPLAQGLPTASLAWILRVDARAGLAAQIRAAIDRIDPAQRIRALRPVDDVVATTLATPRFNAALFGLFAAVALALAVVGLYGVIAFLVAHRVQEIGTRMALGAGRTDVLRIFLAQGLTLTVIGLVLGVVGALTLTRFLGVLLFGVQPIDPASFASLSAFLLLVGLAATLVPAWRATRVDPIVTLRRD